MLHAIRQMYQTDEHVTPKGSVSSNYRMIADAMRHTAAWVSNPDRSFQAPPFDLVWLGMREDGKVASCFADTRVDLDAAPGPQFIRPDPLPRHAPFDRLTLNVQALSNARDLIRSRRKRRIVDRALERVAGLAISRIIAATAQPLRIFWSLT